MDNRETTAHPKNDWKGVEINNLFNKLISYNYQSSKFSDKVSELQDDLCKIYESLLWAEKSSPQILYELFEMFALEQVQEVHFKKAEHIILKNYILIMMNCCEGGILADLLLEHKLPHIVLNQYLCELRQSDNEQMLEYLGSFLKAYHRIFTPQTLQKFVYGSQFELLEISFKFFNCPEPLTNTTVFNIVLALLKHQQVKDFIIQNEPRHSFYNRIFDELTKQFRNQLATFGLRISHAAKNDDVDYIMSQMEDKIALWEDISSASAGLEDIVQLPFSKNVILPLLIGPLLKANELPLFSLKFSLFVIKRMIPVIHNLGMFEILLRMIFIEDNVYYWSNQLFKAKVIPFQIESLLDKDFPEPGPDERQPYGSGIKQFYKGIFRSKDNHFIMMSSSLLNTISVYLTKNPETAKDCCLQPGGPIQNWLMQIMIGKLSQTQCLNTTAAIINTLILFGQGGKFESDLQNQYLFIFKNLIKQTKQAIKNCHEHWDNLIETSQFDLTFVDSLKFGEEVCSQKYQKILKIVFTWDQTKQVQHFSSFYSSIPDTPSENVRYLFVKFMLMRNGCMFLLQGVNFPSLLEEYYSRIITKSPYIRGDTYRINQVKSAFLECVISDEKNPLPALWIKDDNFFVIAFLDKARREVKIIASIKYKHLTAQMKTRKDKINLSITARIWNNQTERMEKKPPMLLKGIQAQLPIIAGYQTFSRQKELSFISNALKNSQQNLPQISLI